MIFYIALKSITRNIHNIRSEAIKYNNDLTNYL